MKIIDIVKDVASPDSDSSKFESMLSKIEDPFERGVMLGTVSMFIALAMAGSMGDSLYGMLGERLSAQTLLRATAETDVLKLVRESVENYNGKRD